MYENQFARQTSECFGKDLREMNAKWWSSSCFSVSAQITVWLRPKTISLD